VKRRCTRLPATAAALAAAALALAACTSNPTSGHGTGSASGPATATTSARPSPPSSPTRSPTSPAPPPLSKAQQVLARMSEAERVGQLLMVDSPSTGATDATNAAVGIVHAGSVILDGTSQLSAAATAQITAVLQERANPRAGLFVATDQEGGQVQRLQGPGFSAIPSAVEQGTLAPGTLQADARLWGTQLRAAGVNVDLAPVLDTVPPNFGSNPPVGDLEREYGRTPAAVSSHGNAVAQGLRAAGVDATVKHFPGLGRVTGNTDLTTGVLDRVTTRHDAYLAPFAAAIRAGVPFVMVSTAIYTRIDPDHPAAFSPTVVTGMLRHDLGFAGVIISDDLGISKQVSGTSVGDRAVDFVAAGGDIVLTVDATQAPTMAAALLARAGRDATFKAQVDRAALTVLQAKQARGLLR
jgi:beta-N-acetylhexosaminidase